MQHVDAVIIGQGLAGTALAWELLRRGQRIAVIDPGQDGTCSKIAAGLVTPLTGARATLSWRWGEMWAAANYHYTSVEHAVDRQFWHVQDSVRLYASAEQRADFEQRFPAWPEIRVRSAEARPDLPPGISAPFGAFSMGPAARLETPVYLQASRNYFQQHAILIEAHYDWNGTPSDYGLAARHVVSCEGGAVRAHGHFKRLNLHPARGAILAILAEGLDLPYVLHADAWLVPMGGRPGAYLLGATYERERGQATDAAAARRQLETRLRRFMRAPFEVLAGYSGVRPASYDKKPLLGRHSDHANLWVMNGLGSKGALLGPWCAHALADAMLDGRALDPAVDWMRRLAP